jgi:calcineurin-like phosphoesterase family protein
MFRPSDPRRLRQRVRIVCTGDYIDRGTESLRIIETLRELATHNPGQVVTLMGNHELMALEAYDEARRLVGGPVRKSTEALADAYATTDHGRNGGVAFVKEFGGGSLPAFASYAARMARTGDIGAWMRRLAPYHVARIGSKSVLFLHADLPNALRERKALMRYLRQVTERQEQGTDQLGGTARKWGDPIFMGPNGVFWNRSFGQLWAARLQQIDEMCAAVGVDFIVTGHTPHERITVYGKRVFDIDAGMTPVCGGYTPQALVLERDRACAFVMDGSGRGVEQPV